MDHNCDKETKSLYLMIQNFTKDTVLYIKVKWSTDNNYNTERYILLHRSVSESWNKLTYVNAIIVLYIHMISQVEDNVHLFTQH